MSSDAGLQMMIAPEGDDIDFWRNLTFSFTNDMDNKRTQGGQPPRSSSSSNRHRSVSTPGIPTQQHPQQPHLAPPSGSFSNLPGFPPTPAPDGPPSYDAIAAALRTLQEALPYLPGQGLPSLPPSHISQQLQQLQQQSGHPPPPFPQQEQPQSQQQQQQQPTLEQLLAWSSASQHPVSNYGGHSSQMSAFDFPSSLSSQASSSSMIDPSAVASTSSPAVDQSSPEVEGADPEISASEDKRRRNTAASARFRIKKKQKTLNLERTVSDLTGRVGELEQEANDLRRENGWLKEIVMLKSRRPGPGFFAAPGAVASTSGAGGSEGHDEEAQEDHQDDDDDKGVGTSKRATK